MGRQEVANVHSSSELGPALLRLVNIRNNYHGIVSSDLRAQCAQEDARGLTVTKKVRLKQSIDMNWKAWDNNAAAYGLPFWLLLVLKDCGRLRRCATSGSGFVPTLPFAFTFG